MGTSISNLNGVQQNALFHLSKSLKRVLRPLMIICYGHRSSISFQSSAFFNAGIEKNMSSVFDIFIMVSDEEILSDGTLYELARRSCQDKSVDNLMIFRKRDVLLNLQHKNRFFSTVLRGGILMHGNKDTLQLLPSSLSVPAFNTDREKLVLKRLLQQAQYSIGLAVQNLQNDRYDPQLNLLLLNEGATYCLRYFMAAHWGIEINGNFKQLLSFSGNVSTLLKDLFPNNTMEETVLFHVINGSFIDEGFCPGPGMIQTLLKRVTKMLAVSHSAVQRKMAQLLPV